MGELEEIVDALAAGDLWAGAQMLSLEFPDRIDQAAALLAARVSDRRELVDIVAELASPPDPPRALSTREALCCREAMGILAARLALEIAAENWGTLAASLAEMAGEASSFRVREAGMAVLERIASLAFDESVSFWQESMAARDSSLAATAIRALAVSEAPVLKVLDLFEAVVEDARKAVRESLAREALPELGRRDCEAVYIRLRRWSNVGGEIARWNVAHALGTVFGGMRIEETLEILGVLAADERPMVWRAVAGALVQVAQRNPRLVLPEIARWRDDPKRFRAANLALRALAAR